MSTEQKAFQEAVGYAAGEFEPWYRENYLADTDECEDDKGENAEYDPAVVDDFAVSKYVYWISKNYSVEYEEFPGFEAALLNKIHGK